jgi:hypothetical protein
MKKGVAKYALYDIVAHIIIYEHFYDKSKDHNRIFSNIRTYPGL